MDSISSVASDDPAPDRCQFTTTTKSFSAFLLASFLVNPTLLDAAPSGFVFCRFWYGLIL